MMMTMTMTMMMTRTPKIKLAQEFTESQDTSRTFVWRLLRVHDSIKNVDVVGISRSWMSTGDGAKANVSRIVCRLSSVVSSAIQLSLQDFSYGVYRISCLV